MLGYPRDMWYKITEIQACGHLYSAAAKLQLTIRVTMKRRGPSLKDTTALNFITSFTEFAQWLFASNGQ
ncbi:hypothetical protein JZ751_005628 [Albula glossodonta]|uniref:Uncharacterized protein n=1 Tax=Albula glossodonta TaxID=121402 RepID=A0A8T2MQR2_9TELE|nr:hypothetical protein JZ751_015779 [Albula glossodonta]KAG9335155.1 hypothetical protein JZ751_005628 [Albula glossodonta]